MIFLFFGVFLLSIIAESASKFTFGKTKTSSLEFLLVFSFLSELRSQNFASFTTTSCQYAATIFSCHTVTETMLARTTDFTWLISTFHDEYLLIDFVFV